MKQQRSYLLHIGVEGSIMTLAATPFIFVCSSMVSGTPPLWQIVIASASAISCLLTAFLLFRRTLFGKFFGGMSIAGYVIAAFPYFSSTPFAALLCFLAATSAGFALLDFRAQIDREQYSTHSDRCLQRVRWSSLTVPLLVVVELFVNPAGHRIASGAIAGATLVSQILLLHWAWSQKNRLQFILLSVLSLSASAGIIVSFIGGYVRPSAVVISMLTYLLLPKSTQVTKRFEHWWEPLLNHPERLLFSTFLGLCILGTLLLQLPGAARLEPISIINAAFTSVSAVCVTGLIVLDTPHDFSLFGQTLILLLIQLGGLGIMTITTVALHAIGQRLSIRQERILATITDTGRHELLASLVTILKFTFVAETVGALVLFWLFSGLGQPLGSALWRGVFTSISAFCNAGFALQSNSLIPYQGKPFILHTVAALIVFGGMAPATSLIVPNWIKKRPIPIAANITLVTTIFLLLSGTVIILALEWNGVLSGFSMADKITNAWFQSVTLRTAGFNSMDISGVISPTFLIMLCFMFIGGSPGGTAGGVKTTTVGILALTFWANVMGRSEVVIRNRTIPPGTINRAVTIICSGVLVWFILVLMLEITQQIASRDIIFEVTSALGTVGLSVGATGRLDGIGKIIIMIAMFIGRIGPVTMFMLLSEEHAGSHSRCPDAHITLT